MERVGTQFMKLRYVGAEKLNGIVWERLNLETDQLLRTLRVLDTVHHIRSHVAVGRMTAKPGNNKESYELLNAKQ